MANPNASFGFKPWRHASGGVNGRENEYLLSTAYATSLFYGDLVKTDGSGNLVIAAAGDQVRGVFAGVKFIQSDGSVKFSKNWIGGTTEKSGTIIRALCFDDPMQLFLVQAVGSMTAADVGQFVDVDTSVAGNSTTGISGQQISNDGGSETTFAVVDVIDAKRHGLPCRNAAGNPDFYATGTNALVIVKIMKHELGAVATTEI